MNRARGALSGPGESGSGESLWVLGFRFPLRQGGNDGYGKLASQPNCLVSCTAEAIASTAGLPIDALVIPFSGVLANTS